MIVLEPYPGGVFTEAGRLDINETLQALVAESGAVEIQPEHYLLLITRYPDPLIQAILGRLGVSLTKVGERLKAHLPRPLPRTNISAPHSASARQVVSYASNEAHAMEHTVLSDGHLILGMLSHDSFARDVLTAAGLDRSAFRKEFVSAVGRSNPPLLKGPGPGAP